MRHSTALEIREPKKACLCSNAKEAYRIEPQCASLWRLMSLLSLLGISVWIQMHPKNVANNVACEIRD